MIPTNETVRRVDYDDVIYKTRREKYNAVIEEIVAMHEAGRRFSSAPCRSKSRRP